MNPALRILRPGPLTTVQDLGRAGLGSLGVSRSGAADRGALRAANRLVGNTGCCAALETTLGGLALRACGDLRMAVTGPPVPLTVTGPDGSTDGPLTVPTGTTFDLADGAQLRMGRPTRGLRNYLAVCGGIDVLPVLGSRSRDLLSGLGPEPVQVGDELPVGTGGGVDPVRDAEPTTGPIHGADPIRLNLILGPRQDLFTGSALDLLFGQVWTVTPASNRIGLRLSGAQPLERLDQAERPSEPMVPGAVQVPTSGQPVIFGPDHPASGGYPVIGVLTVAAQDLAGQARPGDAVVFTSIGTDATTIPVRPTSA
ncbi:biotin-dependent carboxyltransferase [Nakamurella silvestris]|nr:biotin-dependent carboxyltransferase [Nakamurella silvestris]